MFKKPFYNIFRYSLFFLSIFLIQSCASNCNYIYFYNENKANQTDSNQNYIPVLKPDDLIGITVSSIDLDAVKPFNLAVVSYTTNGQIAVNPSIQGILIDSSGMIEYPVIGKIKLAGLNRIEACELLKEKLKKYLTNPIVTLKLLNFKVTVLGDVRNPGTFIIPNERVTILEALGMAGDLNITGIRKNIMVIRESNGKKSVHRVDLTSSNMLNSSVYYLHQNDVIYVEQNKSKINSARYSPNTGTLLSAVSVLISSIYLILTLAKN